MAGGDLGGLYMSLDIKDRTEGKLNKLTKNISDTDSKISRLQKSINDASKDLNKLVSGSDAWKAQKEAIKGMVVEMDRLVSVTGAYRAELAAVQRKSGDIANGKLVVPHHSITSKLDTKPIERQIERYEKMERAILRIRELQGHKDNIRLDAATGLGGTLAWDTYLRRMQEVDAKIAEAKAHLQSLGGGNMNLDNVRSQLNGLYGTLEKFDRANQKATSSVKDNRTELDRHLAKQKEVEAAFGPVIAAQRREAQQQEANRASIEAANAARQRQVQTLREQAEAMMRSKLTTLEGQRRGMAGLYSTGKSVGLDTSELENIRQRYRDISREILNIQTMLQNAKGLSYNDMFSVGRNVGSGGAFVRETAQQIGRIRQEAQDSAKAARDLASAFSRVHDSVNKTSQVLGDMKSLFLQGGIVFGAQQFANSIIQTGGDIVQQHVALRSILGDIEKADTIFAQTQQLALQSPFKFGELNKDVKQLAAFGVETDRLYDTTKRLADVASGLGVSFERLGLAYGQVKARSWLDGKELRQFAYAGLPMLQKIADMYNEIGKNGRNNYTTGDIRDMITKRMVSFNDVDEVFKRMTDEGGQFYNMQFVLSETLLGRWNKLIDAWDIMLGKLADGKSVVSQVFMTGINAATEFVLQLDKISPILLSFGGMYAGKKLFGGFLGSIGTSSIAKEMQLAQTAALKTYATSQSQLVLEGKISASKMQQNVMERQKLLNATATKDMTYMQLAADGRITAFQLGQLARRGEISAELVSQLATMRVITAEEARLITLIQAEGTSRRGNTALMQLGAKSAGGRISGLFSGGNLAMIGAAVGLSMWMGYEQFSNKIKESEKTLIESARQSAKTYGDFLKNLGGKGDGGLQKQVASMKEILETSGDYTDSIKSQIENAKSLSGQYDILKGKIEEAGKANDAISGTYGKITSNALTSTGLVQDSTLGGSTPKPVQWFLGLKNDDLEKNVQDATESLQRYQMMFDTLDRNTQASMEGFIRGLASKNKALSDLIQGLPVSEQIRALAFTGGDDWEAFVRRFGNGSEEVGKWLSDLQERAKKSSGDISEIMYDDVPKALQSMMNDMNMSQTEFKVWAAKNPEIFAKMMDEMAKKANITSKNILLWFRRATSELMNFNFWASEGRNGNGGKPNGRPAYRSGVQGGTLAGDIRAGLRSSGKMAVGKNVSEYDKILRSVQDASYEKTGQNIQKLYKEQRNELDQIASSIKRNKRASKGTLVMYRALKRYVGQIEDVAYYGGVTLDVGKNKTTGHFGKGRNGRDGKDEELETVRNRVELYKRFFSEYKNLSKTLGQSGALSELKGSSDFKSVFGYGLKDVTDFAGSLDALTRSLKRSTEARGKFLDSKDADKSIQSRKELEESVKNEIAGLDYEMDVLKSRYDIYRKIMSATGNGELSNRIAFQGATVSTPKELVRSQMARQFGGNIESADRVLGMDRRDVEKNYGKDSAVGHIWQKGQDDTKDRLKEALELYADLVTKHQTIQDQIDAENNRYKEQLETLKAIKWASPEEYTKVRGSLDESHAKNLGDLEFKQFKQDNGWEQLFRDLDRVSAKSIDSLLSGLRDLLSTNDMSEEGVKAVVEAMDKLTERKERASPFASIAGGYRTLSEIQAIRNAGTNANGKYVLSSEQASRYGLKPSKTDEYSKHDIDSVEAGVFKGFENSVKGVQEAFEGLQAVLAPVEELFDALGSKGLGEGMGVANKAIGSAASVAGGFSSLAQSAAGAGMEGLSSVLGKAGPYGAAAAAALSIGTSMLNKFGFGAAQNKRFEKQNEYLKSIQGTIGEINNNLKTRVDKSYGSASRTAGKEIDKNLHTEANEVRKTYYDWTEAHTLHKNHRNRMYTGLDYDRINSFLAKNGYRGKTVNAQNIQNLSGGWLEKIKNSYAGMWAKLPDDAKKFLDRIIAIEGEQGELTKNTEAMAEALTDLSLENVKSEWKDLLNQLDSDNQDFAENFEKHMREAILGGLTANLYAEEIKKRITEASALAASNKKGNKYIAKDGMVKEHTGSDDDTKDVMSEYTSEEMAELNEAVKDISERMRNDRDLLKKTFGWSDKGNSKAGSSIKNITEETADIIAAYCNAIRLDVSVNRTRIQQIADAVNKVPELNGIAQSQLMQLRELVSLAQYRNGRLDDMYNWMRSVTKETGSKHLSM